MQTNRLILALLSTCVAAAWFGRQERASESGFHTRDIRGAHP